MATPRHPRTGHSSGSSLQVTELCKHPCVDAWVTSPGYHTGLSSLVLLTHCVPRAAWGPASMLVPGPRVHVTAAYNSSDLMLSATVLVTPIAVGTGLLHH